jgi:hypothetical protein
LNNEEVTVLGSQQAFSEIVQDVTVQFPIRKRVRITLDVDVVWEDQLGSREDPEMGPDLENLRRQMLRDPALVDHLFTLEALETAQVYLGWLQEVQGLSEVGRRDALLQALTRSRIEDARSVLAAECLGYAPEVIGEMLESGMTGKVASITAANPAGEPVQLQPLGDPLVRSVEGNFILANMADGCIAAIRVGCERRSDLRDAAMRARESVKMALTEAHSRSCRLSGMDIYLVNPSGFDVNPVGDALSEFCEANLPDVDWAIYS